MKQHIKIATLALLIFSILITLPACSLQQRMDAYAVDKEECYLNDDDVRQFSYQEKFYTILEQNCSNDELGDWVGYIRKFAAVDSIGRSRTQLPSILITTTMLPKGEINLASILIVDDEKAIRELIKNGLRKDGHIVTAYASAAAVPMDSLNHFDLILLDIMMPDKAVSLGYARQGICGSSILHRFAIHPSPAL